MQAVITFNIRFVFTFTSRPSTSPKCEVSFFTTATSVLSVVSEYFSKMPKTEKGQA